jgi:soluble lytic murein transglycosylase-like protein
MKSIHATTSMRSPRKPTGRPVSRRTFGVAAGLLTFGLLLLGLALLHGPLNGAAQRSSAAPAALPDTHAWLATYSAYDAPAPEAESVLRIPRSTQRLPQRPPEILPRDAVLRLPAAPTELRKLINEVAAEVKIAPALLHAVIATESRYNSDALSPRGAIGLMQLMPETALRFGAPDPYNPRDNVVAGANYLKFLFKLFDNDVELVLAAYNAGHNAVLRAGNRIPEYPETLAYVPKVLAYMRCASSAACRPA